MPDDQAEASGPDPVEDRGVLWRPAPEPSGQWHYGPHSDQVADVFRSRAATPASTVVLVHGGFWRPDYDRRHLRPFAQALVDRGHTVVSLEYRRTPGVPDDAVDDLRRALDRLGEVADDGDQRQLVGHSAGGHLALLLAADPACPIGSCLALAPVADLEVAERLSLDGDAVRGFLGAAAIDRPDLDPARLPRPRMPTTLLHGLADSIVPVAVSEAYVTAVGTGPRLTPLAGVGHFALVDPTSRAWPSVVAELDALRAAAPGDGPNGGAAPRTGIE